MIKLGTEELHSITLRADNIITAHLMTPVLDGGRVAQTIARTVVYKPGDDISMLSPKMQELIGHVWTDDVKREWKERAEQAKEAYTAAYIEMRQGIQERLISAAENGQEGVARGLRARLMDLNNIYNSGGDFSGV